MERERAKRFLASSAKSRHRRASTRAADQLLSGTEIELLGHLTAAITKLEQRLLGVAGKWPTCQRLQELPGIGKILGLTNASGKSLRLMGWY